MEETEIIGERVLSQKRILSTLDQNLEMYGDMDNVKLYSCDKEGKNWLYSDVHGYLCLILDYTGKTIYIRIYDSSNYQILFQYELYNNFSKTFQELAPDFFCFEIDSGFMGIKFETDEEAQNFNAIIKRLSGLKADLLSKPKAKEDEKSNRTKIYNYIQALKEKFPGEGKYDEKYAADGIEILNFGNFQIMDNISYDQTNKQFKFGNISEELKNMFRAFGIKKKELERDANLAFTVLSLLIVGLSDDQNKVKNPAIEDIEHVFPPPEERQKIKKQEEENQAKLFRKVVQKKDKKKQDKQKNNNVVQQQNVNKKPVQAPPKPIKSNIGKPTPVPTPTPTPMPMNNMNKKIPQPPKINQPPQMKAPIPVPQQEEEETESSIPIPPPPPEEVPSVPTYIPPAPKQIESDIPAPPDDIPLPPPSMPTVVPIIETKNDESSGETTYTGSSYLGSQIQNVKLKPIEKKVEKQKKIDDTQVNFLMNTIHIALMRRKNDLERHKDDNEGDDDDDDWD